MNEILVSAVVGMAIWSGVLSVVVLALIRELAILRFRMDRVGNGFSVDRDGLEIGHEIPEVVRAALHELNGQPVYVVILSATCTPCWQFARSFLLDPEVRAVALLSGSEQHADEMEVLFPRHVRVIRDPVARRLAEALRVRSTPFALQLETGRISGKAYLRNADELTDLVEARRKQVVAPIATLKVEEVRAR